MPKILVSGLPLARLLGEPLSTPGFLSIAVGLAAAVRQLHGSGLIHKDIRPANVLVGDAEKVRLMGFGMASWRDLRMAAPAAPELVGRTLPYMAPEQLGGSTSLSIIAAICTRWASFSTRC